MGKDKLRMNRDTIKQLYSGRIGEIVRFGIVGIVATTIQYALYYVFLKLCISPGWSFTVSYGVSWLCNFVLSARFTFKKEPNIKRGIGFALSHGFNYVIQLVSLNLFIWNGVSEALAPLFVYCICIPINFLMVRFVFNKV